MQADAVLSPSSSLAHHCQFSPSHPYWNLGDYSCYVKDQGFFVHPSNILSQPLILNTIYTILICSLWSQETQPYFPQTFKNTSVNTTFIFTFLIMISVFFPNHVKQSWATHKHQYTALATIFQSQYWNVAYNHTRQVFINLLIFPANIFPSCIALLAITEGDHGSVKSWPWVHEIPSHTKDTEAWISVLYPFHSSNL